MVSIFKILLYLNTKKKTFLISPVSVAQLTQIFYYIYLD